VHAQRHERDHDHHQRGELSTRNPTCMPTPSLTSHW
jgi:hypothetical protein